MKPKVVIGRVETLESSTNEKCSHPLLCLVSLKINVRSYLEITLSILVRVIFVFEVVFVVYILSSIECNDWYYFLIIGVLFIIIDGIYVAAKRFGKEYTW